MSGNWTVDAVKGGMCTQMAVSGPSNPKAWNMAQAAAEKRGVDLSLGTCGSRGYDHLVKTFAPKTFTKSGYTVKWGGRVWSK